MEETLNPSERVIKMLTGKTDEDSIKEIVTLFEEIVKDKIISLTEELAKIGVTVNAENTDMYTHLALLKDKIAKLNERWS